MTWTSARGDRCRPMRRGVLRDCRSLRISLLLRISRMVSDPLEEETVAPAIPLAANLIEFPRELVAARKARPRLAEGPLRDAEQQAGNCASLKWNRSRSTIGPGSMRRLPGSTGRRSGWMRRRRNDRGAAMQPAPWM